MYTSEAERAAVVPSQRGGVAAALLAGVSALDDEALTVRARELAGEISAATANLAAVLAEVERREIHARWECRTIERFAGWHCQLSWPRAHSLAAVGRAMAELPAMAEAVADGTLSFDKARCVATSGETSTEGALVQMAVHATPFRVSLRGDTFRQPAGRDDCTQQFTFPVGDSSWSNVVVANYGTCNGVAGPSDFPACLPDGTIPPLPPGQYQAVLVTFDDLPAAEPVTIQVR